MESLAPPSKIPRVADPGTGFGLTSCWNMERNGWNGGSRSSPPIGLGLELGRGSNNGGGFGGNRQFNGCNKSHGFTIVQFQELQLQSLIYKYIEAGYVVPYNLVLPIWNSVVASFGGLSPTLYQLYPTFMGGSSPVYLEYKNGMDPEPGRCRRTDGKKWRCSREALPDQKYCERHMHRGRHRSRKLVEAAPNNSSSLAASTNLSISLPITTSTASSHFSPTSCGFSPKSVLLGDVQKN